LVETAQDDVVEVLDGERRGHRRPCAMPARHAEDGATAGSRRTGLAPRRSYFVHATPRPISAAGRWCRRTPPRCARTPDIRAAPHETADPPAHGNPLRDARDTRRRRSDDVGDDRPSRRTWSPGWRAPATLRVSSRRGDAGALGAIGAVPARGSLRPAQPREGAASREVGDDARHALGATAFAALVSIARALASSASRP